MLNKYLKKLGLSSYTDLNEEEKETYKQWEAALNTRKITDDDFKDFLNSELDIAVSRITEEDLSLEANAIRKAEIRILKKIKNFLDAPLIEKSYVEQSINQLLGN